MYFIHHDDKKWAAVREYYAQAAQNVIKIIDVW